MRTPAAAHRRNAKDYAHFPVSPPQRGPQIGTVRRLIAPVLLALTLSAPLCGADDPLAPYSVVAIKPATTSIIIATVSMTMPPFVRKKFVYSSTYYAKVFPYFFYNERGRIWIIVSDDDLRRVAKGQTVDVTGHALSDSGEERKVNGRATPTGPTSGKIKVRVFVTRRIALVYDTTYELLGKPAPLAPVTPK
jgi:hypothetical protein